MDIQVEEGEVEHIGSSIALDRIQKYIRGEGEGNLVPLYTSRWVHILLHRQSVVLHIPLYMHWSMFVHFLHTQDHISVDNYREEAGYIHIHIRCQRE